LPLPKPPPLPLPKPPPLLLLKPPPLPRLPKLEPPPPPKLPLLKPPLNLLPRAVLWALNSLARELETLEQVLWLKLRLLLKLLRQWADKVLARLGFNKQCNQPRKLLVARRAVSPQYLKLLVVRQGLLLVTSVAHCLKGFKHSLIKSKVLAKAPALKLLRQTQARDFGVSKVLRPPPTLHIR
jgi:hypothetical protein